MIAVDTNLLVYAHRRDSSWHAPASRVIRDLAEGARPWALPWPAVHEFLAIVTHPRIYDPPTALEAAAVQVEAWLESPAVVLLAEGPEYWSRLRDALAAGQITGARVHDARIAALCADHGIAELWSADRDFSRFPRVRVANPLLRQA